MVYYYLFGAISIDYYFRAYFNLKVILYMFKLPCLSSLNTAVEDGFLRGKVVKNASNKLNV